MRLYHFFFALLIFVWGGTCALNRQMTFPFNEPEVLYPGPKTAIDKILIDQSPDMPTFSETAKAGKTLFRNNCASCHNKNMRDDMTAPALANVQDRWEGREVLLLEWIKNSSQVLQSGDSYALALYEKWNKSRMPAFNHLTDKDIMNILAYVNEVSE